jgi:hypothetical protein
MQGTNNSIAKSNQTNKKPNQNKNNWKPGKKSRQISLKTSGTW